MIEILIAAFIIIISMVTLMVFILQNTIKRINRQTKTYFVDKLQIYDDLISDKEQQLEEINNKIKQLNLNIKTEDNFREQKEDSLSDYNFIIPDYRDSSFFENYKSIKKNFNFNKTELVEKIIKNNIKSEDEVYYNTLKNIETIFDKNIFYQLLTLTKKEQLDFIKTTLTDDDRVIFDKYIKKNTNFSLIDFKKFIEDEKRKNNPVIYVKTGDKNDNFNKIDKRIKTVYDHDISEGLIVIYKDKIYDYSL